MWEMEYSKFSTVHMFKYIYIHVFVCMDENVQKN